MSHGRNFIGQHSHRRVEINCGLKDEGDPATAFNMGQAWTQAISTLP